MSDPTRTLGDVCFACMALVGLFESGATAAFYFLAAAVFFVGTSIGRHS